MSSNFETIIDNDDTVLRRNGNQIILDISAQDYPLWEQAPNSLQSSLFLTSIDTEQIDRKTVRFSTILDSSETLLDDYKDNLLIDCERREAEPTEIMSNIANKVLTPFLQIVYAQQQQKTWQAPLHPDNLLIDNDTNRSKAIMRYPQGTQVDDEFVEDVTKMILYILFPSTKEKFQSIFTSEDFVSLTANDLEEMFENEEIAHLLDVDLLYEANLLLNQIFEQIGTDDFNVRGALEMLDATDEVNLVDETESVLTVDTPEATYVANDEPDFVPDDEEVPEDEEEWQEEQPEEFEETPEPKKEKRKNKDKKRKSKQSNKPKNKKSNKKMLVGVGVGVLTLGALLVGGGIFKQNQQKQADSAQTEKSSSVNAPVEKQDASKNENFYQGTLAEGNGQYSDAVSYFNKFFSDKNNIDKYEMTKNEKTTVYVAYIKANQSQVLLDKMTPFDKTTPITLTNYLLLEKQNDQINNLKSNNKYIKFAKAYLKHDNQGMIENANADLSTNKDLAVACGEAFGSSGDLSGAKTWLQSLSNTDVQKQATQAVINSAQSKGMKPDDIKKALNVD